MVLGPSGVLLQTKLDDTKSYYQLIIEITISKPSYEREGKFSLKFYGDQNQGCNCLI